MFFEWLTWVMCGKPCVVPLEWSTLLKLYGVHYAFRVAHSASFVASRILPLEWPNWLMHGIYHVP